MRCDNALTVRYGRSFRADASRLRTSIKSLRVNSVSHYAFISWELVALLITDGESKFRWKFQSLCKKNLQSHILCSCWSVCLWWPRPLRCRHRLQNALEGSYPWCGMEALRQTVWSRLCLSGLAERPMPAALRTRPAERPPSTCLAPPPSRRPPLHSANTVTAAAVAVGQATSRTSV